MFEQMPKKSLPKNNIKTRENKRREKYAFYRLISPNSDLALILYSWENSSNSPPLTNS